MNRKINKVKRRVKGAEVRKRKNFYYLIKELQTGKIYKILTTFKEQITSEP